MLRHSLFAYCDPSLLFQGNVPCCVTHLRWPLAGSDPEELKARDARSLCLTVPHVATGSLEVDWSSVDLTSGAKTKTKITEIENPSSNGSSCCDHCVCELEGVHWRQRSGSGTSGCPAVHFSRRAPSIAGAVYSCGNGRGRVPAALRRHSPPPSVQYKPECRGILQMFCTDCSFKAPLLRHVLLIWQC